MHILSKFCDHVTTDSVFIAPFFQVRPKFSGSVKITIEKRNSCPFFFLYGIFSYMNLFTVALALTKSFVTINSYFQILSTESPKWHLDTFSQISASLLTFEVMCHVIGDDFTTWNKMHGRFFFMMSTMCTKFQAIPRGSLHSPRTPSNCLAKWD